MQTTIQGVRKVKNIVKGDSKWSELIRFGLVGGVATILQYIIYVVFVDVVKVPAVPSTLISYAISFIYNYIASSLFTFRKKPNTRNALGFIASHALNMGLQTGIVAIFKGITGPSLALLPAFAICIPVNFLLVRFVFNNEFFCKEKSS
ncbi:MAG: GtrA family protein [Prevotella sp.]|nr:GtrA family protein [Bacteroides sp.]MCM1366645.1 GtrA family protein [Prevotella sp.]MCM1437010.1 GtrA family protein [Prevotella sp.]